MTIYESKYQCLSGSFFFVTDTAWSVGYNVWAIDPDDSIPEWRIGWVSTQTLMDATVVYRDEGSEVINKTDPVEKPSHYMVGGYECLDVIEALGLDFLLANAFKYIWRAGRKDDTIQDIKKARYYLDRWLEYNDAS